MVALDRPPFRADHVGSLLRPPALLEARAAHAAGDLADDGLRAADPAVYPDLGAFWSDLSAAYAAEVRGLAGLGCTYLQLDDTSLAYLNDPAQRELVASMGGDPTNSGSTGSSWSTTTPAPATSPRCGSCLHGRRQRPHLRAGGGQAAAHRRDGH
jgi:hypothetical protein